MAGATKLMTAGGGGVSLTPASSIASDVTVNVPSQNCTLGIQGPAFSAYKETNQSISNSTWTKIAFNAEEFDTNSNFDTSTNRFTPTVAGYYQINATLSMNGNTIVIGYIRITKNGSAYKTMGTPSGGYTTVSSIVYCNGSTDYIEVQGYVNAASNWGFLGGSSATYINGALVRAA